MLIALKNDIEEISRLCIEIQKFCSENEISDEKYHDIILILDEMATNIINYAYPNGEKHSFFLEIKKINNRVCIKLTDSGIAFDPLAKSDPDVNVALEERQIGGLGIFIVKQLSESVEYSRVDDKNLLDIKINLHKEKK